MGLTNSVDKKLKYVIVEILVLVFFQRNVFQEIAKFNSFLGGTKNKYIDWSVWRPWTDISAKFDYFAKPVIF